MCDTTRPVTHSIFHLQALEGKDIKELLTNVGSAGPAAPAGGAAAPAAAEAPAEEKKKEEGKLYHGGLTQQMDTNSFYREGGVRRGHGLRSVRLSALAVPNLKSFPFCPFPRLLSRIRLSAPSTILSCTRYSTTPATKI